MAARFTPRLFQVGIPTSIISKSTTTGIDAPRPSSSHRCACTSIARRPGCRYASTPTRPEILLHYGYKYVHNQLHISARTTFTDTCTPTLLLLSPSHLKSLHLRLASSLDRHASQSLLLSHSRLPAATPPRPPSELLVSSMALPVRLLPFLSSSFPRIESSLTLQPPLPWTQLSTICITKSSASSI